MSKNKVIGTIVIESSKPIVPRVTRANQVMRPKKGRGSYQRSKFNKNSKWEGGSLSPFSLTAS